MTSLHFEVLDSSPVTVEATALLNAGYAGRDQAQVRSHIDELAALGIALPSTAQAARTSSVGRRGGWSTSPTASTNVASSVACAYRVAVMAAAIG